MIADKNMIAELKQAHLKIEDLKKKVIVRARLWLEIQDQPHEYLREAGHKFEVVLGTLFDDKAKNVVVRETFSINEGFNTFSYRIPRAFIFADETTEERKFLASQRWEKNLRA